MTMFESNFLPGGPAFAFLDGRIQTLKVVSVEFVDPAVCGGGNPYGVAVHVAMPDGKVQVCWDTQGVVFPRIEDVLATLLPEGYLGMKVSLSGEPVKNDAPQGGPAPAQAAVDGSAAPKPDSGKRARTKVSDEGPATEAAVPPAQPEAGADGIVTQPEMF